jgi:4'-phosphopantetheinyl transferase
MTATGTGPLTVDWWFLCLPRDSRDLPVEQLTAAERSRAARQHHAQDRAAFSAARLALRRCLSVRLGQQPSEVRIEEGGGIKPRFPDLPPGTDVSLTRRRGAVLIGICDGARIGVDIEAPEPFDAGLAASVCSSRELADLEALPSEARSRAFARIWTRKEAITKAIGVGVVHDLTSIDVSLDVVPRIHPSAGIEWTEWELFCPDVGGGWEAAIAVNTRGRPAVVRPHFSV